LPEKLGIWIAVDGMKNLCRFARIPGESDGADVEIQGIRAGGIDSDAGRGNGHQESRHSFSGVCRRGVWREHFHKHRHAAVAQRRTKGIHLFVAH